MAPTVLPATAKRSKKLQSKHRGALLGAMFLMATSAVGPGFIVQTTTFTVQLGAAFAFAIVVSILVDIAVQLNVWRVIGVSGKRAQELANTVLPGAGWFLAALICIGGLVFNVGNIAGTGLGINVLFGIDPKIGGLISAAVAIAIFLSKRAGLALDKIVVLLGAVMILLIGYVAIVSQPPLGEALKNAVIPDNVDFLIITTLIGGTIGGYITYAGAHRMIDAGVSGHENVGEITRSSILGIIITGVIRVLLFLAILGVVAGGVALTSDNLAAEAFQSAAGDIGLTLFGVILWAASITSVIGAAYTSISFVTTAKTSPRVRSIATCVFIAVSATVFTLLGQAPATLLIMAGAVNGLILPVGFAVILWVAWRRRDLLGGYVYPKWLLVIGVVAWLLTLYLGYRSLGGLVQLWA
ncbi:MAG: divalent metal cation transporter [Cryobacterium sp.]|uniref:NRAMP family divalent metal transporter n=1 Tax=unclassified Cryobacterium TaxID=2649013 RepID=UPI001A1B7E94|nr:MULTISPECIES: NRAMP family divalent metal transporter [unclassified Cryobacterium]MCY7403977.1 divalent metal cation transporter [Cryobacterium sp.]MEC5155287.1 Mn2+/Fe2+ NRAMP family transporter [Cryobacterium sp. CAN_C3]